MELLASEVGGTVCETLSQLMSDYKCVEKKCIILVQEMEDVWANHKHEIGKLHHRTLFVNPSYKDLQRVERAYTISYYKEFTKKNFERLHFTSLKF